MSRSRAGKLSAVLGYLAFAAIPLGFFLRGLDQVGSINTCSIGFLLLYVGAPLLALAGILVGVVAGSAGGHAWKIGSLAFLFVVAGYFLYYPSLLDACWPRASNDASAVGSLRTLNTAIVTYQSTYGKPPARLAQLGPDPRSQQPNAPTMEANPDHSDLIDSVLARGRKSGYVFTYTPGPLDAAPFRYEILGRPEEYEKTGRRNCFTDETGVIRSTLDDRPATKDDPPLS